MSTFTAGTLVAWAAIHIISFDSISSFYDRRSARKFRSGVRARLSKSSCVRRIALSPSSTITSHIAGYRTSSSIPARKSCFTSMSAAASAFADRD